MLSKVLIWKVTLELRPEKASMEHSDQEENKDEDPGLSNGTGLRDSDKASVFGGRGQGRAPSKVKNHSSHDKEFGFFCYIQWETWKNFKQENDVDHSAGN